MAGPAPKVASMSQADLDNIGNDELLHTYTKLPKYNDMSKRPQDTEVDFRGVTDWGNLLQFAPYESGYCFLVVLGAPTMFNHTNINDGFEELQLNFVKILENEFKGLSGLEDWGVDTYTVGINNSYHTVISKVKGMGETQITMNFTEKTGTPITKYCMEYLRRVRNPYSEMASYNGATTTNSNSIPHDEGDAGFDDRDPYAVLPFKEVFNMLYIVTDSTCLQVEKAFALINAKPMSAGYSDLYNMDKGNISTKDATVTFSCSVREGAKINATAQRFLAFLINTANNSNGLINLNSNEFNYSISGTGGVKTTSDSLTIGKKTENDKTTYKWFENESTTKAAGYKVVPWEDP